MNSTIEEGSASNQFSIGTLSVASTIPGLLAERGSSERLQSLQMLTEELTAGNVSTAESMMNSEIVEILLGIIGDGVEEDEDEILLTSLVLSQIANTSSEIRQKLVNMGCVPLLIGLIQQCSVIEAVKSAVVIIGLIASDSEPARRMMIENEAIEAIVGVVNRFQEYNDEDLKKNCIWCASFLSIGAPSHGYSQRIFGLAPLAAQFLGESNEEVVRSAARTMVNLSGQGMTLLEGMFDMDLLVSQVVNLLGSSVTVAALALRICGNFLASSDHIVDLLPNESLGSLMEALVSLLSDPDPTIRREACWSISNTFSGSFKQIHQGLLAGALEPLIHIILEEPELFDSQIYKDALWGVGNLAANCSPGHLHLAMSSSFLSALQAVISNQDIIFVQTGLTGASKVMQWAETNKKGKQWAPAIADALNQIYDVIAIHASTEFEADCICQKLRPEPEE
jgi:hypothetical protein